MRALPIVERVGRRVAAGCATAGLATVGLATAGLATVGLAGCTQEPLHLTAIEPALGSRGAAVTLRGEGFCPDSAVAADDSCAPLPSGAIDFGLEPPMVRAPILAWRATTLLVEVPDAVDIGATTVYVTVDGRTSNGVTFEVLP